MKTPSSLRVEIQPVWSLSRRRLPILTLATLGLILPERATAQPALTAVNLGDRRPGTVGAAPEELTNVEGILYFTADDGTHGRELWKSDPRTGETKLVIDLHPGAASLSPGGLVNFQGRLYFAATTPSFGHQLWVYDPASEQTEQVVDVTSRTGATAPESLTRVGPFLFFTADDGTRGRELWFHWRRRAGRVVDFVKDNTPGPTDPHGGHRPLNWTVVGTTLFFSTSDGLTGLELRKAEAGSVPAGTKPVAILKTSFASSSCRSSRPTRLVRSGAISSRGPSCPSWGTRSAGCMGADAAFPPPWRTTACSITNLVSN